MRPICQAFNRRRSPSSSRLAFGEANLPIKLLRATLAPSRFVKKSSDQVLGRTHQALRSKISCHQDLQRKFLPIKFVKNPSSFWEQNLAIKLWKQIYQAPHWELSNLCKHFFSFLCMSFWVICYRL
jgi:hypothetical protein